MTMPDPEIEHSVRLIDVDKTFPDGTEAVRGVSLDIRDGEFFAVLGPSGSGKSTTLRMIGGFETVTGGRILIRGIEMGARPPFQRDVNTVFQSYGLFPHLDVFENVGFGLRMARVTARERAPRVAAALESVKLTRHARRRIDELSGGEQQRVALARALVNRPGVLLLDEPLGALDLKLRQEMQLELKSIQQEVGITFIHVTHDQDEAIALADRMAVMHEGRIAQFGMPVELYEQPATRFVAQFIGRANELSGTVLSCAPDKLEIGVSGLGTVSAKPRERVEVKVKDAVTIVVRPERVHLSPTGDTSERLEQTAGGSCTGRVRRSVYRGSDMLYEVAAPGDRTIEVLVSRQELVRQGQIPVDTDVDLGWSIEATVVIPEAGPATSLSPGRED
jgi:spermidine/putrescine transport system ATP-binding protein